MSPETETNIQQLLAGIATAAVGTGGAMLLADSPHTVAAWSFVVLGVALFAINAVWIGVRAWRRRHPPPAPPDTRPDIIGEHCFLQKMIGNPGERPRSALVATLVVYNKPRGIGTESARVAAHLDFTDKHNRQFSVIGRWGDDPLPAHPNQAVRAVEIAPGLRRCLDLAINFHSETRWYALDDSSPFDGYRVSGYELEPTIVIGVRLVGNVDERFVVWIKSDGKGSNSIQSRPAVPVTDR